jgi:hemoglobin
MKQDIKERKDIELLVNTFYQKVRANEMLGRIFDNLMQVDWNRHLPKMYNFWENILYQNGSYKGFPLAAHFPVNEKEKLTAAHFDQWMNIFNETVGELFEGEKAEEIKMKALSIKGVWSFKMDYINQHKKEAV